MYSIGYDVGSSSIKCSILEIESGKVKAAGFYPEEEMAISTPKPGYAEQDPEVWWEYVKILTHKLTKGNSINADEIVSIGITYQMHGLVLVDKDQKLLRPSIIWCDSRAVEIGQKAFEAIGEEKCLTSLLNSPGNFTASKLRWVKENEPDIYGRIYKAMLPGDFIAMKLSGEINTTISGLSEGIFWDFQKNSISEDVLSYYQIDKNILAKAHDSFEIQCRLSEKAAIELGLKKGTPISYRAGDQPNNAFSLKVLNPGEIAATAGTSGVVYGVTDKIRFDAKSRVNQFAHVNYSNQKNSLGVLLCINGTGILNSWLRKAAGSEYSYNEINVLASEVAIGSEGVIIIPFGNGSERVLENKNIGCSISGLDFNRHSKAHLFRAAQEGIAFSFKYGIDIMGEMGLNINVVRAGKANMFLSPVFRETLANLTGATIELYDTDGAQGAARGAALGAGYYKSIDEAFNSLKKLETLSPDKSKTEKTLKGYDSWLDQLNRII
ncbi:MAG: FGGY family carbohydrate kinase [Bacteroidota bacterium]|nr:FGGY family carbohydrate kinase [Bacteroidota bacterium]